MSGRSKKRPMKSVAVSRMLTRSKRNLLPGTQSPLADNDVHTNSRSSPPLSPSPPADDYGSPTDKYDELDQLADDLSRGPDEQYTRMLPEDKGYLTPRNSKHRCLYIHNALDLEIPVREMHFDVSAGYTNAVCDVFYWHIDYRLSENKKKRGILFIVPQTLTLKTLNHFARLFVFNKTSVYDNGEPMEVYKCPIGGDECGEFMCNAHRLWHMEVSVMMKSCEEARKVSVTKAYAFNCTPGYVIDDDILNVLRRTWPWRRRRNDLIRGDKPPCRLEQRAGLTFRRAWHHSPSSAFHSYTHNNNVLSNHREGELEYRRMPLCGLDIFIEKNQYFKEKHGRAPPLRDEYPHVYKMPFILPYSEWNSPTQRSLAARNPPIVITHDTDDEEDDSDRYSSGSELVNG